MSIVYKIYGNDGHGGPIDYSRPIGTTSDLSYPIALPTGATDFAFGVRAAYAEGGNTEANTEAAVRVLLDESGQDITGLPPAPTQLSLSGRGSGPVVARWYWRAGRGNERATHFAVTLRRLGEEGAAVAEEQVAWVDGKASYRWQYEGPLEAGPYEVQVQACNTSGPGRGVVTAMLLLGTELPPYRVDNLRLRAGTPRRPYA